MADYAAPVALGIKAPSMSEAMTPISTMLNARNTAQQFQQGQVQLQQSQMDLEERNNLRTLAQDIKKYQTKDGGLDLPALVGDATRVAPKTGMAWAQQIASSHAEGIKVNSDLNRLAQDRRKAIGEVVMSLADKPLDVQQKMLDAVVQGNPGLNFWADMAKRHLTSAWQQGPEAAKTVAFSIAKGTMGVHEQAEATTPGGPVISSGQTTQQYNTKTLAGPVGPVAGTAVQADVPPTAGTVDASGNPQYVGPRKAGGPIPSGPKLGVPEAIAGSVEAVNKDWEATRQIASNAQQDIGVLQNIKKYANDAITGVGSSKRQVIEGFSGWLASKIGMDMGQMAKTSTDLLAKNSNMLALAGGDTNLARTMAEAANPNTHMTPEAIRDAADQVIAQRKMALAKQKFMQPYKAINDAGTYSKALSEFNQNADPRILQLESMSKEEKQKMMGAMSATERTEFIKKVRRLHDLGFGS